MRAVHVILNPAAGGGSAGRRWPSVERVLASAGCAVDLHQTTAPGHARHLARHLAAGAVTLIAVGGDGTVNEVVNGLMDAREQGTELPSLGIVPATTGNDFARSLGMPLDPGAAAVALLASPSCPVDIGRVEFGPPESPSVRYFALACHLGLAAEVADRVNRSSKRWGGTLPFLTHLLALLPAYRACRLRVRAGESTLWNGPCLAAVLANGERLGGGMRIAPGARVDDGLLDLVVFGDLSLARRLRDLPLIYTGGHVLLREVSLFRVDAVSLESDRPTLLDVDGETIGRLPARVSITPGALRVLWSAHAGNVRG